jgi:hypothetical protein
MHVDSLMGSLISAYQGYFRGSIGAPHLRRLIYIGGYPEIISSRFRQADLSASGLVGPKTFVAWVATQLP